MIDAKLTMNGREFSPDDLCPHCGRCPNTGLTLPEAYAIVERNEIAKAAILRVAEEDAKFKARSKRVLFGLVFALFLGLVIGRVLWNHYGP